MRTILRLRLQVNFHSFMSSTIDAYSVTGPSSLDIIYNINSHHLSPLSSFNTSHSRGLDLDCSSLPSTLDLEYPSLKLSPSTTNCSHLIFIRTPPIRFCPLTTTSTSDIIHTLNTTSHQHGYDKVSYSLDRNQRRLHPSTRQPTAHQYPPQASSRRSR